MAKITHKSKILKDEYTEYVCSNFDIQNDSETVKEIEFSLGDAKNFEWNIGVIYGSSGCGKTSILKRMGELSSVKFDSNKSLISNFDFLNPKDASRLLSSIGLSSVPTWLRPYHLLSNGEKYRAELAYKVGKASKGEVVLIDEYTSVVDRDVAKAMSFSLQKYLRREGKKVILASCHYDIMEWLMPDWISSPQKNGGALERGQWLRQGKPNIELSIARVESSAWDLFKEHHYLTSKVNKSCKFFMFSWSNKPVGIVAVINQPRKGCPNGFALSRTVVLPDFQGMGIGSKISEICASMFVANGGKVYSKTISPALGMYRDKSDKWRGTSMNGKIRKLKKDTDKKARNRLERASYCHEYVGEGLKGYENLMLPIKEMRMNKNK